MFDIIFSDDKIIKTSSCWWLDYNITKSENELQRTINKLLQISNKFSMKITIKTNSRCMRGIRVLTIISMMYEILNAIQERSPMIPILG